MPLHTAGISYVADGVNVPVSKVPLTVDSSLYEQIPVPAGATKEVDIKFDYLKVRSYMITLLNSTGKAEATLGEVDIKWNDSTTGAPEMDIVAKAPIWHFPGFGTTQLFTENITKGYFHNVSAVDLIVSVHVGLNAIV